MRILGWTAVLALVGCGTASFDNPLHPSGSRTLAAADGGDVIVLNVEEGTVTKATPGGAAAADALPVGSEPTRIARLGDRYFVTLRGEGALAVLVDGPDGLEVDTTLPIGAEPYGVVTTEDGRLFVALSRENQVIELDADTLDQVGEWDVPDEPRWLAVSGNGRAVFAGCLKNGSVYQIDLKKDAVTRVELPTVTRTLADGEVVTLTHRVTGDMSVSPDGRFLAVPVFSVDNTTGGNGQNESAPTTYGGFSEGPGQLNPGVALVGLDNGGTEARPLSVLSAAAFTFDEFFGEAVIRSFPSAAVFSPDGDEILVPMEGSNAVTVLALGQRSEDRFSEFGFFFSNDLFEANGFAVPPTVAIPAAAGARSVVFTADDRAVAHGWIDRGISTVDFERADEMMFDAGRSVVTRVEVSQFTPEVERGREHFNTARNPVMQAFGSGISCGTCHFDGREDGLTWPLENGPRQTMNLGGRVSETLPITWDGSVQQVSTEVILTSGNRMGGEGADPELAAAVAAYIDTTRGAFGSWRLDEASVQRGEAIFNRPEVGCAECHPAPTFTDGNNHAIIGGRTMNTPTLRGLAASAPYFHNGEALDLDAVLSTSRVGVMGDTSMLSTGELDDLRAYLMSL